MIPFNIPPYVGTELDYVKQAVDSKKICGDGSFTKKCHKWLETSFECQKALLTTSGTTALEMAAILCDLKPGDEGTVFHVDDAGTVHVNWDCGSTLGMVYGVDVIRKL